MPATITIVDILDRIRAICSGPVFGFTEAPSWVSFDLVPSLAMNGTFRIPPPSSQSTKGRFDFSEERTESVQIWVARPVNSDYPAVREQLLEDRDALIAAIVRDAFQVSGDYNVPSEGRGYVIQPERTDTNYVSLRLTLAVNYDAQL